MALDYSKRFYHSKEWKKLAEYIRASRHYTCEECGEYGTEVHHIIAITPDNIDDPNITLNEHNLELLCKECHDAKRKIDKDINEGLRFDPNGNIIQVPPIKSKNN